jgi:tetratricopeptide (TPR) repeat protein
MTPDVRKRAEAMQIFKLALKADAKAVHRTLNRPPKGKGWVPCATGPDGLMCRPDKLREAIELFKKAYATFPDVAALNQVALRYEMLGEVDAAREAFTQMKAQALGEQNVPYVQAADMGLARTAGIQRRP